jgi:hypothetical protein
MSEDQLKDAVIEMAQTFGWLVHHDRPARTEKGWRTAIQGDPGFPDLVLARRGMVLVSELKRDTGGLSDEQKAWLYALGGTSHWDGDGWLIKPRASGGGLAVGVWRPWNWSKREIEKVLR